MSKVTIEQYGTVENSNFVIFYKRELVGTIRRNRGDGHWYFESENVLFGRGKILCKIAKKLDKLNRVIK